MYVRDFVALLLAVCAMYVSMQREGTFSFRKAWYHPIERDGSLLFDFHAEKLPAPFASDLNGDGTLELVAAAYGGRVELVKPAPAGKQGEGFARARVIADKGLNVTSHRGSPAPQVVYLASGHLDPAPESLVLAPRKQSVLVVTSDWKVLLLNHNLDQIWRQDLSSHFPAHTRIEEVAGLVTSHAVRKGDRGLVVVGGAVHSSAHDRGASDGDVLGDAEEEGERARERGKLRGADAGAAGRKFFSYFAFEGASGEPRWRHEAKDFERDLDKLSLSLTPQNNYKITAESLDRVEYGSASCREYRQSVLGALPHSWSERGDTAFALAHFSRRKRGEPLRREASPPDVAGEERAGASLGRTAGRGAPATRLEHGNPVAQAVDRAAQAIGSTHGDLSRVDGAESEGGGPAPNVVVAHLAEGIEAVHLYSGKTVCKLHLQSGGLHADLNGDGVVDHIRTYAKDSSHNFGAQHARHQQLPGCWTLVTSGVPAHEVFNASVCKYPNAQARVLRRSVGLNARFGGGGGELEIATPALIPAEAYRVSSAGDHPLRSRARGALNAVFLNSHGEVTCLGPTGRRKWSVQAGSSWFTHEGSTRAEEVVPTLAAMELRVGAHNYVILTAGSSSANVLSAVGRKLLSFDFPASPNLDLKVMDFNSDGLNDLVLCTPGGYYGYAQVRHFSTVPFTGLLGCLIVTMLATYVSFHGLGGRSKRPRGTE